MRNVRWPARMQRLTRGPLREAAPDAELWLDGGHNPHAAQAIAATLAGLPPRPTHLVFALLDNRSPADFLAPLLPHLAGLRAVSIPGEPKSTAPEVLAARARALGIQAEVACQLGNGREMEQLCYLLGNYGQNPLIHYLPEASAVLQLLISAVLLVTAGRKLNPLNK